MKKIFYLIILLCLLFTTDVYAEESKTGFINCIEDNSPLYVRSAPNTASSVSSLLYCNTSVIATDTNAGISNSINWYKIKYGNNLTGYVDAKYVAFDYLETESNLTNNDKVYVSCVENDSPLYVSSNTNSYYPLVAKLSCDTQMTVLDKNAASNSVCPNWYKVTSGGYTGYVCGSYTYQKSEMSDDHTTEYKNYLKSIGFFDESYLDYLVNLHASHPTWQFRAIRTRTNWDDILNEESVKGRSLIYYTKPEGYRSTESYSYNYETDTYYRHSTETDWWYASKDAIGYYMDPRNFLTADNIFMFESLYYQPSYQTKDVIRKQLDSSFIPNVYANYYGEESRYNYADDFLGASATYNVSPVHIGSRIAQEYNPTTTVTYNNNTYSAFNFFNIRATGVNPQYQGLLWAANLTDTTGSYGRPWDNPSKAIYGGTQFLSSDYIGVGQDTLYFQKFAVYTTNHNVSLYAHQYQQNIMAPLTEGQKSYNSYASSNQLDSGFVFTIPVYDNMPKTAVATPKAGNPNSYLKNLTINGNTISEFTYNKTTYSITLPASTNSVIIGASTINSGATVAGTGTFIIGDSLTKQIVVTSSNGNKTTYDITVNREKSTINTLKSLTIDKIDLEFNKDNLTYNANVNYNVTDLNISYEVDDAKATVTGPTTYKLSVGANKLEYKVTSESGEVRTYIINVIRKDANGEVSLSNVNALKSLTIDKINFNFNKETLTYNLIAPYTTSTVNVSYEVDDVKALVDYNKTTNLKVGNNVITITVRAENLEVRTYTLNIRREDMSVETILNSSSVKYNSSYISGINIGANVSALINKIKQVNNSASVTIKDKNNNIITDTAFKTGTKVSITSNNITNNYEIVILGDIDGNGEITKSDMLAIQKQIFGYGNFSGSYAKASDIDKDGKITKSDLLAIQKHIFGYGTIKQ